MDITGTINKNMIRRLDMPKENWWIKPKRTPIRYASSAGTNKGGYCKAQGPLNADKSKMYTAMLKTQEKSLRRTGRDPDIYPTLELCLIMDCTASMGSWIE